MDEHGATMQPTVYLETTIPSYLAARPSRDLVVAAHQQLTHEWWESRHRDFRLVTSQFVVDEVSDGDPELARRRLSFLDGVALLATNNQVEILARAIVEHGILAPEMIQDAFHIAIATAYRVDFLLTWNCKHIANIMIQKRIGRIFQKVGLPLPGICTPEEILEL